MMVIPREAKKITYSTNIRLLKKQPFSQHQRVVAVGTILGDACLATNWSKTNYRLQIRHAEAQKAYVQWKYEVFKDFVLTPPQYYPHTESVWFRTISHPDISGLHQLFYQNGKKVIPANITQMITDPLTIAVWFMDDGNVVVRKGVVSGYHLNTQSFSKTENEVLVRALRNIYGIECTIERNHTYYRLAIWRKSSREKFVNVIRPYILPSMKYKIG